MVLINLQEHDLGDL